ncbi:DUF6786 family protein [Gaoshiqia sediminis]|uniref:Uncharacterized protein n=1 Tax=Gaoshiqia sediminis TaxID=2986998 RepID=A0AA41Y6W3_9BACT|nr:DUF6786 family protein [Gaoshiqia sediminis]MCW0482212.1 hypothetical protein [Gaoshiqia sediminis]
MPFKKGQYGYDFQIIQEKFSTIELVAESSRVVLAPELQGRVMTSTTSGKEGFSFGWVNHELLKSDNRSEQFNAFGGEERFWLGPEGGQFSVYFEEGKPMQMANWKVPAALDIMPWEVQEVMPEMATFYKEFSLKNYSGTKFKLAVTRRVGIIFPDEIADILKVEIGPSVKSVAYESLNQVKNTGEQDWNRQTGLLSIWMLSMYNPSPGVTIVVPFKKEGTGPKVKDDYFGNIPADRLKIADGVAFFKADGKQRSKIGISPERALPVLGSYDTQNRCLTILETTINPEATAYVNSEWEECQQEPFKGDVINAYNDGPLGNGAQLGPFYELESSSEALALQVGEARFHVQRTYHFEGSEDDLNRISQKILGVSLQTIKEAFD